MKRDFLILLALVLLAGCTSSETGKSSSATEAVTIETEQTEETTAATTRLTEQPNVDQLAESEEKHFSVNGKEIVLADNEWKEILTAFLQLKDSQRAYPKSTDGEYDYIRIEINEDVHYLTRVSGNDCYISFDDEAEYAYEGAFARIFDKYCNITEDVSVNSESNAEERLIGLSVQCDEPKNQQEYLDTARRIVAQWLDTLPDEDGRYHLESYAFTDDLADNRVFHGDGYVNGGREFVCYVGFDTPTEDDNTAFYAIGTYDTFYHYYFGPGVLARFRWENGVCTLIDYSEAYAMLTSDRLKDGLFGISENEIKYKTFYDFMNDNDNVNEWLAKDLRNDLCVYRFSHNVMMLANGKVVFMDVGNNVKPIYNGEYVTTDMCQFFYDSNMDGKYTSPIDYIDGSGAVVMTYRDGFSMEFDDYNHDGNPDYAIRISSDEHGSRYDVRCVDINGRPWEDNTEIYIYGEFEESIRLQVSDSGAILNPTDDGNGGITYKEERLFSDKSGTSHADITEDDDISYRMYSQRFYLPETLRSYTSEDDEVICYFWNNTAEPVTVGREYEIQCKNESEWETVSTGTITPRVVDGNSCARIVFDISDIASEEMALYRIKTTAAKTISDAKTVYGGFYFGTKSTVSLDVTAEQFPEGCDAIRFEITNTGMSVAFPVAELYSGQKKLCSVNIDKLNSGTSKTVMITESDISGEFIAGEYTLKLTADGKEFFCTATVVGVSEERLYYFPKMVTAKLKDGDIILSLTNNIWNEETVTISSIGEVTVMNHINNRTMYMNDDCYDVKVAFGETAEIRLADYSNMLDEYEEYFEEMKNDEELAGFYGEKFAEISSMTFREYISEVLGICVPEKGDLCRVVVKLGTQDYTEEYIYFEMP